MQPVWAMLHPQMTMEHLGFLPSFLSELNPMSAKVQIDANYRHGGGWRSIKEFRLNADNSIKYPGDPVLKPLAMTKLRDETIIFYDCAIVAIIQPDRSFEVARID